MVAIKGHFDGKVFVPDEPVDLPRGQTLVWHVEVPAEATATKSKGQGLMVALTPYIGSVTMPPDWALEHDHYLYGTPKRNEPENGKE